VACSDVRLEIHAGGKPSDMEGDGIRD